MFPLFHIRLLALFGAAFRPMLFNSAEFCLVFFPLVTGLYFLLPYRWRWLLLLLASCWFYMAFVPVYVLILAFTIGVDYASGILIESAQGAARKRWLIASVAANVGVLAVFKYWNFLNQNIALLVRATGLEYHVPDLGILLPIGLSFHTFQSLSYTIEVYYGRQAAERRPGIFALYVMFYPQLVAGPIERPGNLLRQLGEQFDFDAARVIAGLKQMLWGFFKKLVIADRAAVVVDMIYADPGEHNALVLLWATYLFALQIYGDFSGYTDIALGAARVMGYDLMVNFRTPYQSTSIREFWSRWHISLSSWFRDYVYIPLGGNKVGRTRWYANLFAVFLLSGLWHGANWTYVVWGGLHGAYLVLALICAPLWQAVAARLGTRASVFASPLLARVVTFHLVVFAWIFFRAADMQQATAVVRGLVTGPWAFSDLWAEFTNGRQGPIHLVTTVLGVGFLLVDPLLDPVIKRERELRSAWQKYALFSAMLVGLAIFGHYGDTSFIYFQF
jgi:alginate O-acetyltransferase complex protein AlgI